MEQENDLTVASYAASLPQTTAEAAFVDCGTTESSSSDLFAEVESTAAGWMLNFACRCLCRHFCEGNRADFERSRDLALSTWLFGGMWEKGVVAVGNPFVGAGAGAQTHNAWFSRLETACFLSLGLSLQLWQ